MKKKKKSGQIYDRKTRNLIWKELRWYSSDLMFAGTF